MHLSITITGEPAELRDLIEQDCLFTLAAENHEPGVDVYREFIVSGITVVPDEGPGTQISGIFNQAFDQDGSES